MKYTAHTKTMNKTLSNIVAVVTALSLVFLQMPIVNVAQEARADAAASVSAQAELTGSVDVKLSFEHAFITYEDQVIAPPASKVTLPLDSSMVFTAEADSGYQVDSVVAVLDGQKTTLKPNDDGEYKISASSLQSGEASIEVKAISAPEVATSEGSTEADEESGAAAPAEAIAESADATDAQIQAVEAGEPDSSAESANPTEPEPEPQAQEAGEEEAAAPADDKPSGTDAAETGEDQGAPAEGDAQSDDSKAAAQNEGDGAGAAGDAKADGASSGEAANPASAEQAATPSAKPAATAKRAAAARKLQAAALPDGVWDLADTNNTKWFHVSTDESVTENEQQRDASFKLTFTYSLTEDVVRAMDAYNGNPTLVYDLSSMIANAPVKDSISGSGIISIGTRKLGTYTIADNKVTIVFTDQAYLDDRTSLVGYFTLTMETDETKLGSSEDYDYSFPGTTDIIPITYKKTVSNGTKTVNSTPDADGNYTLSYTAKVTVNTAADSLKFIDSLSGMQKLDASSVKINGKSVNVTTTSGGFEFDVAQALGTSGVDKGTYTVTYNTKVSADQLSKMSASKDTETNKASWKVNGTKDVPGGETTTDLYKPRETVPVTKTITNGTGARQPGDVVEYKITYGSSETKLAGLEIADYLTDVQTLQGDITLQYGSTTTTIPASAITADDGAYSKNMVTLFDYTFPSTTQGTGPVTVTYKTKIIDADTAKANGIYDATDVANTAQEKRYGDTSTTHTTVKYEKEKVLPVTKTESSAKNADGAWAPGSEIAYTLTVGDAETDMAGVNISDTMTDLQVLQGDVKIKVGNGAEQNLKDYVANSIVYNDDGNYSTNDVTLFNFTMPSNAGKGPVVITYTTKVISQDQASDSNVYGNATIRNSGRGGNGSASTSGTGVFENFPIDKKASVAGADVSNGTVKPGDTIHYTLSFGNGKKDMAGVTIYDEMTDMQRVVSDVTVTKADGTSYIMPTGSGQWSSDGYVWDYFDDGNYSQWGVARVFNYTLPRDIGAGPITIEYDAQVISEDQAKSAGVQGVVTARNTFRVGNASAQTNPTIDLPSNYEHKPQISKDFSEFDLANNLVYWNITVEKQANSAYPLENVVVGESNNGQFGVSIYEPNQGFWNNMGNHTTTGADFDLANAVVTTDEGVVLTPGVDYTIDKAKALFTFPVLNERVHISLAYKSPAKIIDGYKVTNWAYLQNPWHSTSATAEYNNPGITLMKGGTYTEDDRVIEWEVQINPTKAAFADSNPISVLFKDAIPEGLTLLNYATGDTKNPTAHVKVEGSMWREYDRDLSYDASTGEATAEIASLDYNDKYYAGGLNGNKFIVKYKTKLSDEAWDALTSSATGSQEYENHVKVTAGEGESFETTGKVEVTSEEFIVKTDSTKDQGGVVVDDAGNATKAISYTVEINPHSYTLNPGKTLSVTDYIDTNMDLDTASVTLVKVNADGTTSEQSGIQISYNDDSRLLSIGNIPDNTHFRLTYSCNARAQGQDTFKNTATLIGAGSHSSTTVEEHKVQTSDAGVRVDSIETFLHKIDENNIKKNLDGAKFQLYECKLAIGDLTNEETYDQAYWDKLLSTMDNMVAGSDAQAQVMEQFKIIDYVEVGEPVTTRDSGYTQWNGLSEHKLYAWKEIQAPEGYTASDEYHYFVGYQHINVNSDKLPQPLLSDQEQLDRKHAAWALDDATQLANGIRVASMANLTTWTATNIETEYTSISATKKWEGDSDNLFETRPVDGISLQLYRINADGSKTAIGDPVAVNADPNGEWPSYLWSKLPTKDAKGNELAYTVVEAKVPNYSTSYSDDGEGVSSGTITVTNKMIPKNTTISVKKEFGEEVPESAKPAQVIVELLVVKTDKNGNASKPEAYGLTQALNDANGWQAEFSALPTTDSEGHTLTYTVREDSAAVKAGGFKVTYSDNQEGVVEASAEDPLVVTNTIPGGSLRVVKTVEGLQLTDEQKQAISFTVTDAEGATVAEFTLADMDEAQGKTIDNLKEGLYTVTEEAADGAVPAGYKMTTTYNVAEGKTEVVSGQTSEVNVTNAYTPETTSVSVKKVWDDANDQDGLRADVTVNLLANGRVVDSRVLGTQDGSWSYTFTDLPKSENGALIDYTVTEVALDGYTSKVTGSAQDGYVITNTHAPETVEVQATKVWDDADDQDGLRADVTLRLMKSVDGSDSEPVEGSERTLAASASGDQLKVSWEDLPKFEGGAEVIYTVVEDALKGYSSEVSGSAAAGFTVTNTHVPETVEVSGTKTWDDADNQDGIRPETVTVKLMNGETLVAQKTVKASDGWSYTFKDLPKYAHGELISYTVDEDVPAGYAKSVEGANLTNTHVPETVDVSGTKTWADNDDKAGNRPTSVTVNLFADGTKIDSATVTAAADGSWSYAFEGLPQFAKGNEIVYTVSEDAVVDYETSYDGYDIVNTYKPETVSVSGAKDWDDEGDRDGVRPDHITIRLLANGSEVAVRNVTADDGWAWSFNDLPKRANGEAIVYTIAEDAVEGYTSEVDGYNVKNSRDTNKIDISGTKTWDDANNQDGIRPNSITVHLYADGVEVASKEVAPDAQGNWAYEFAGLDENRAGAVGEPIKYTVSEDAVDGYTAVVDGTNITNTHAPETVEVQATKTWDDADDQDGLRADVTLRLVKSVDGSEPAEVEGSAQTIPAGASGEALKVSWTDLPKYEGGAEVTYTVVEDALEGYSSEVSGSAAAGFTVTNTHVPESVELSGTKTWDDEDNQDGIRPNHIVVNLLQNGTVVKSVNVEPDVEGNWTYAFTDLPKRDHGEQIVYSVTEDAVVGYDVDYTSTDAGYDIKNTHKPGETSVSGSKIWEDASNQDGARPNTVPVNLLADGEKVYSQTIAADAQGNWNYSFTGLPEYSNGHKIVYTVEENSVAEGYEASIDSRGLVNTHVPETIDISGAKTWNDADNQDGIRPASITVYLKANGETVRSAVVSAADEWSYAFTDLPKFQDGQEIAYTVAEDEVEGYTAEIDGFDIVNTHTPETTRIAGSKTWVDANDQDGIRPASLTVNLLRNGEKVDSTTITAASNWGFAFEDLPAYTAGVANVYTVDEVEVEGYAKNIDNGTYLVNTHVPETIDVSGTKTWDDADNQDGLRPASISVQLLANGSPVEGKSQTVVPNAKGEWVYTFAGLPKYAGGEEIRYTVAEAAVDGYTPSYDGMDITNVHVPGKVSLSGTKIWEDEGNRDGVRPASIVVKLMNGDEEVSRQVVKASDNWTYSFSDLPEKAAGETISYTIEEEPVEGYDAEVTGTDIVNTHESERISIPVSKVWRDAENQDGARPENVRVRLQADGVEVATALLDEEGGWSHVFENLPKYREGEQGQAIAYTLTEDAVDAYTTTVSGNAADGFTVTNVHAPETIELSGSKTWDDVDNQDGIRPDFITVNLLADGKVVDSKTVSAADNWAWTFADQPKFAEGSVGQAITYTVSEEAVSDYAAEIDGLNIANAHTPETTRVEGTKTWNDASNQDGKRPKSITLTLLADGQPVKSASFQGEGDTWTYAFEGLPKYAEGNEMRYTVTEAAPTDYAVAYSANGLDITNSYTPEKTSVSGSKEWDDNGDQDGIRPTSVVVKLLANDKQIDLQTVTAASNWAYSFGNLDKYADGKLIEYTVEEDAAHLDDYESSVEGFTITNRHAPETTSVSGEKVWADAHDQDGIRPDKVTVNLWNGSVKVASQDVSAAEDGSWSYSFTDLPKFENGEEIVYTVTEEPVAGYVTSIEGTTITNTHVPEKTQVSGEKIWSDANDQDGIRPEKVTVRLFADGEEVASKSVAANESGTWAYTFDNLDKYADGEEIDYTVAEDEVSGYTTAIEGTTITNAHMPEKTSVSGTKSWDDANDQDGKRPTSVVVNLLSGNTVLASQTITPDDDGVWAYEFTDLDKYANGEEITYAVSENAVYGYAAEVNDYDIANAHAPEKTSVSGTKSWDDASDQDGKRPESVTVNLLANGEKVASKTVTAKDGWAYEFTDLDKYADGKEITYTVSEEAVADYTTVVSGTSITNVHAPEKTSVSGTKTWNDANDQDGIRPESITVRLLANGTEVDSAVVEPDAQGVWSYEFTDLDKYAGGSLVTYTVAEDGVEGYETTYEGYDIVNTHTPGTTAVSGVKVWNDQKDQDGKRPASVTVRLLANGTEVASATTTAQDNWAYSFADLPEKAEGAPIEYTVEEDAVEGYSTSIEGTTVINTYTPETVDVSGQKTWVDANDQDGIRPDSVTVNLLADGTLVQSATATAEDGWAYSFTDLPKYRDGGTEIVYTITEDAVEGYEATVDGFDVTNTHVPETISLEGTKAWNDANDQDGKRPGKVLVNLLANGEKVAQAESTPDNGWTYRFSDVAKYANGTEIVYTVEEEPVADYDATVSGLDVTNAHTPEKTSVSGTKTWNDADDQDGIRPTSIVVNLLANGTLADSKTVTPNADGTWAYGFDNLDKYADGTEVVYTVTEDAVEGYATTYNGFAISNSHTPRTTSVSGTKTWNDDNNRDGLRPTSIQVSLLADGKATGKVATASEETNWTWAFEGLPEKASGKNIVYTVAEEETEGYTSEVSGMNLANTHEIETIDVSGAKTWSDADNQDGIRPAAITVNLKADGKIVQSKTVTAEDGWAYSFTELPKYRDGGTEIVYTISEQELDGYEAQLSGTDLTNVHETETIDVSGKKTWIDANDQDGIRPDSVTVNLLADGEEIATATVTAESGWAYSFIDLPKYRDGGTEIVYTVTEDAVEGYETTVDGFDVTNVHVPAKTSISGTKTWSDDNDRDGIRPNSITVLLLADGTEVDRATVSPDDEGTWSYAFTDKPAYKAGNKIVYTVAEAPVAGYVPTYTKTQAGFDIENAHTPDTTSVSGTKTWNDNGNQDGKRPDSITVALLADGVEADSQTIGAKENWSWAFADLAKYRDGGEEIVYTVDESDVADYEKTASGTNLVNTHTPETVEVSGTKTWADADNQDGIRPAAITVNLKADGKIVQSKTVTAEDNWAYSFTNLPKYEAGTEIAYSVAEGEVAGYTAEVEGFDITNTHTPETIELSGTKTWVDANNQDGKRPAAIVVTLLADGEQTGQKTVTEADNWAYTFTDLPKYAAGEVGREIAYTVEENELADYTASANGLFLTNWHDVETIDIAGTKVWDDANDQDGVRPDSVTVRLLADGVHVRTATATAEGGWAYSFEGLPKYRAGEEGAEVVYTVVEEAVSGYDASVDGYTVTNKHTPETTEVSGVKTWDDANDQDGIRPSEVQVALYADGEQVVTATATAEDGWSYTFSELPKYRDHGTAIVYTVEELDTPQGYEASVDGFDIANAHTPETTEVAGAKVWDDSGNQDGVRPSAVQVSVYGDDELVATQSVSGEGDTWAYSFTDLPKYRDHGTAIVYTVKEAPVAFYATSYDGTTITNSHTPDTTAVSGSKTWSDAGNQDGKRPESITVSLLGNGVKLASKTVSGADNWAWAFPDLALNENGAPISYTIVEEPTGVAGYTSSVAGYDAKNAYVPETVDIAGTKTWVDANDQDGKRPASITVNLLANGTLAASKTVEPTADGTWAYAFTGMPKYADGALISYSLTEDAVEGYTTEVHGFDIVNTHDVEKTRVSGAKTWNDANDQDGKRPASITVRLYANGEEVASKVVTAADNWAYSFENLDKYADGEEIGYTVEEDAVEGYTTEVDGFDIANTHVPETTSVSGVKTWDDAEDQDGKRPASITVRLLANGTEVASKEVSEQDGWAYSFTGLPKYAGGKQIGYIVVEDAVEGYASTHDGFNITNVHVPGETSVSGVKTWADAGNQDGIRPAGITVRLLANNVEIASKTVTEADKWAYEFTGLPEYEAGEPIEYSVVEDEVAGYESEQTAAGFTNTHVPETVEVSGTKTWDDADDQDGIRPESITLNLLADGQQIGSTTATAADGWAYSFADLPKYREGAQGEQVVYTVTEEEVAGYEASVKGFDIVNAHTPETTEVFGTKAWNDAGDQDGIRPSEVQVALYADGEQVATTTATAEGGWAYSFEGLPKYRDHGTAIAYTVEELSTPQGYEASVDGFSIVNTHAPETTEIAGTKVWDDANDQDGIRPDNITVNLLANGDVVKSQVVSGEGDAWAYSFTDLPKYADGKLIAYSVAEGEVPGYATTYNGTTIVNAHTPGTTSVSGFKTWSDDGDRDGIRPASITVRLLANGEEVDSATVTKSDNWSWAFEGLPEKAAGKTIEYTVTEDEVAGYASTAAGFNIANAHESATVEVSGVKTWNDGDNRDGIRPASVTVNLLADGEVVDTATASAASEWAYSFTGLPKYRDHGTQIEYAVSEVPVEGYAAEADGFDLTNTHKLERVDVSGVKAWNDANDQDGIRPQSVTVHLLADGVDTGESAEASAETGWAYSFAKLAKYAEGEVGKPIDYTVVEDVPEGYEALYGGMNVTNVHVPEKTSVSGTKTWNDANDQDGIRPAAITVNLYANGTKVDSRVASAESGWAYEFAGLDKFANGEPIAYTVGEDTVPGYASSYEGFDIVNTHVPGTTAVSGTKNWDDNGDQDGKRPDSITVRLLANGAEVDSATLTEQDGWSYSFEGLPEKADGSDIAYTIAEDEVADYEQTVGETSLVNTHIPELIDVAGTKTWSDANDQDGKRPDSITVNLLADGVAIESADVEPAEDGTWSYAFTGLPKYQAGTEIAYAIAEAPVAGYSATVSGYDVTNALDAGELAVSKSVEGGSPEARFDFTVTLDDQQVNGQHGDMAFENGVATFTLADGETAFATGLPAGVGYVVTEAETAGYEATSEGASGTVAKNARAEAAFTNTYAATGSAEFFAVKNLVGRTLRAGEFSFELLEDGKVVQTAVNDGSGYARFDAVEYDLEDVGEHAYSIREVQGGAQGVTYDDTVVTFTATVSDAGDGRLAVTYDGYDPETGVTFTNEYASAGTLDLTVAKNLDGKPATEAGAFSFQLVDGTGAVVATAENDEYGAVVFPGLAFDSVGTYKYTIREVVPADSVQIGNDLVYAGVAYDRSVIGVEVEAIDNGDGTLRFEITYADNTPDAPAFDNTSVAPASFVLEATKHMEGRDFAAGDAFTFTLEAQGDDAPLPDATEVTIRPTSGSDATVSFGAVDFTSDQVGKTFTYVMTEQQAPADAKGVSYDPFAHVVEVTVGVDDEGHLVATPTYENDASGITFTNTYTAQGEAQLFALKTLEGRALQSDEFFFTLSGDGLAAPLHAGADADGRAEFAPIGYTLADAGKDFTYTITEDQGALPGIAYDDAQRTVTVHVEDAGDGTLQVSYDGKPAYEGAAFTNTYTAQGTSIALRANKVMAGGELAEGQFAFTLRGVSDNAAATEQTVTNAADGTIGFDAIDYDEPGVYEYEIAEVVPADATDNGDGTFTADSVVYDGVAHVVVVTVTDDGRGSLAASASYDGYSALTITNGAVQQQPSSTTISFDKYYYGGTGAFDFVLATANADGSLRSGDPADIAEGADVLDDGVSAFALKAQNGAFASGKAEVVFPEISYVADGDYYYLAYEDEEDTAEMIADDAQYLVHVSVAGGEVAEVSYELIYDGVNYGATDDHSFYNNSAVTLGFSSLSAQSYTGLGERVSVYPQTKKYLNGSTDQLLGGDFEFELVDEATGTVIAAATNDENGNVAFFDETVDPGLVYDEPGEYRYIIREVAGDVAGITYDASKISLVVSVSQADEGLVAETFYNGPGGSDPAFYNTQEGMDVTVQKVSRSGGEGLANCTYALWMASESGDVLIQEAVSDERGYITFTDVNLAKGQKYYFKEVAAPSGHTLDPYRTAYFALNEAGDALVLVEETAADGWHSAADES